MVSPPSGFVLTVNGVPVKEATPIRLWRKNNQAAILDFDIPIKTLLSYRDVHLLFRQGDVLQLHYGIGTGAQRIFYGYLPAEGADRNLKEGDSRMHLTAVDFIGQLQSRTITLGDSASSFFNPVGGEIGGVIASLVQDAIDSQYTAPAFSIQGIEGTDPAQTISDEDAGLGTKTTKAAIDAYTKLAYDDAVFPDAPLLYEYHQRDQYLIWRKQRSLATGIASMILTIGKDAIPSGMVEKQPVYTDALVTGTIGEAVWQHADRDTSRRWGGRRFTMNAKTTSSYLSDAYEAAVRNVEIAKHERTSFSMDVLRGPFLLYPGDLVDLRGGRAFTITDGLYRVEEVDVRLSPTVRTRVTVGTQRRGLTDFF